MAYVNMTVDGQTKKTSVLNFKDVNDNLKTATLSAVLEASDQQSGGMYEEVSLEYSTTDNANGAYSWNVDASSGKAIYLFETEGEVTNKNKWPYYAICIVDVDKTLGYVCVLNSAGAFMTLTTSTFDGNKASFCGTSACKFINGHSFTAHRIM